MACKYDTPTETLRSNVITVITSCFQCKTSVLKFYAERKLTLACMTCSVRSLVVEEYEAKVEAENLDESTNSLA